MDKSAINRTVVKLEQSGYISKDACQQDKRRIYLKLTQKALDKQTEITNFLEEINAKIKRGFTAQEYEDLINSLDKLERILDHNDMSQREENKDDQSQ